MVKVASDLINFGMGIEKKQKNLLAKGGYFKMGKLWKDTMSTFIRPDQVRCCQLSFFPASASALSPFGSRYSRAYRYLKKQIMIRQIYSNAIRKQKKKEIFPLVGLVGWQVQQFPIKRIYRNKSELSIPSQTCSNFSVATMYNMILLVKDINFDRSISFYQDIVGLSLKRKTESMAEFYISLPQKEIEGRNHNPSGFAENSGPLLVIKATSSESFCCTGYSPLLTFAISDMSETIMRSLQGGCTLDGTIQYAAHGQVATLRSPDGHMISFYEPATPM